VFKFTIRELVLLTLVVAMGVGWGLNRRQLVAENMRLQFDLEESYHKGSTAENAFISLVRVFDDEIPGRVTATDDGQVLVRTEANLILRYPISLEP
jgi:hypothetical protein